MSDSLAFSKKKNSPTPTMKFWVNLEFDMHANAHTRSARRSHAVPQYSAHRPGRWTLHRRDVWSGRAHAGTARPDGAARPHSGHRPRCIGNRAGACRIAIIWIAGGVCEGKLQRD